MKPLSSKLFQMLIISFFINFFLTAVVIAESSVWKIQKNNATVYLGGTIHVLRPTDYPLPKEFSQAYKAADIVTFETDIQALSSPALAMEMMQTLSYSDARTIKSEVSAETYQQLTSYAASLGIPLNLMPKAKPGLIMSALTMTELQKMGVSEEGIDMFFLKSAQSDGKRTDFLETPQQQINMLANLGIGNENKFYQTMLRDLTNTKAIFLTMIEHWRSGNSLQLDIEINQIMKKESPKMYQSLLVERNNAWLPKVEAYFKTNEVEFVLVGAAHLIGEDGLINGLKKKGYQVTQLK